MFLHIRGEAVFGVYAHAGCFANKCDTIYLPIWAVLRVLFLYMRGVFKLAAQKIGGASNTRESNGQP